MLKTSILAVSAASLCLFPAFSHAATGLALDARAVYDTRVANVSSRIAHRGGETPSSDLSPAETAPWLSPPYTVVNRATPTTTRPEAEEHIAADPLTAGGLLAAISDFSLRGGFNTTKYAFSFSDGAPGSWVEGFVPLLGGQPVTGDGLVWEANSDPVVAFDQYEDVFLADLYFNASNQANGLYVAVGDFSAGPAFQFTSVQVNPVSVNPDPSTPVAEDKPWIAVDNSFNANTNGNVYVSWTRFTGGTDAILLSQSTDGGFTWSAPLQISHPLQNGAVQASQPAVGPNGEIYVVYEVAYVGNRGQQFIAKSADGGFSFSTPRAATPVYNKLSFSSTYRKNSFASLGVSPADGRVSLVYSDQPDSTVGAEVEYVRSTDGGLSFSAPKRVNDVSTGQQFFPALAVDGAGRINVSWFDTRNASDTAHYDVYASRSTDGGASFSVNTRVTTALIDAGAATFIGDYAGVAAQSGEAHPVWTSGGFNGGALQTATLQ